MAHLSPAPPAAPLVLTNIAVTNSGTYTVTYSNSFGTNTASATLLVTTSYQYLSSNNLVVARVGDGAQPLSDTTGNTLYLDQWTPSGTYSNTVMIPDNAAADNLIVSGGPTLGPLEAFLSLSANSNYLTFAGYDEPYPNTISPPFQAAATSFTAGSDVARTLGNVNPFGVYTAAQTDDTLFAVSPFGIFCAFSIDGFTNFYATGSASAGGIKNVIPAYDGAAGGNYSPGGSGGGCRVVNIVNGNIAYTDASTAPVGIWGFLGEPSQAAPLTAAGLVTDAAGSPNDFAASPDLTSFPPASGTVYLADRTRPSPTAAASSAMTGMAAALPFLIRSGRARVPPTAPAA